MSSSLASISNKTVSVSVMVVSVKFFSIHVEKNGFICLLGALLETPTSGCADWFAYTKVAVFHWRLIVTLIQGTLFKT